MLYLPGGKKRSGRIGEAVQNVLNKLDRRSKAQAGKAARVSPADLEAVERLASAVRQRTEQEAQRTRARLWDVGAQRDPDDPYANELLFDALEDYKQIPAYYEALFRRQAEQHVGVKEEINSDVVEGAVVPPRRSTPEEDVPRENKENNDGQGG